MSFILIRRRLHRALTDGVTHYRLQGPPEGPAIVLIPGATLPLFVWSHLNDRLAGAGFRVLSYDLFGRGLSDRPWRRYDAGLHDRQLRELLDALEIKRATLIGLAFGMLIAAGFAVRHPERAERIVAMAPDGFGVVMRRESWIMRQPLIRGYLFSLIGTHILKARLPTYSDDPKVIAELQAGYHPTLRWKGFKRAVISSIDNMPIHDAVALYRQVSDQSTPVKVIWGARDAVTPFPGEARLREAFPTADLDLLQGAGHLPHYEAPARVAAAILNFLPNPNAISGAGVNRTHAEQG